jgi:hypothetical protein
MGHNNHNMGKRGRAGRGKNKRPLFKEVAGIVDAWQRDVP